MTDMMVDEESAAAVTAEAAAVVEDESPRHETILAAIVAAMAEVTRLEKGAQNKEQGYKFASVDDFLAMVNPICAKHGLIPMMDEDSVELVAKKGRYGDQDWLRFTYTITLWHVSGQHTKPTKRQVEVLRSGAQAFGSAQSYVLKQYLRGLFLIATGDKDDPDYGRIQNGDTRRDDPDRDADQAGRGDARRSSSPRRDGARRQENLAQMAQRLSEAKTGKELREIIGTIPNDAHATAEVAEARIERLRTLIKGAANMAALEAFKRNFQPDWEAVKEDAEYRASELAAEDEERRIAEAEEALRQRRAAAAAARDANDAGSNAGETDSPIEDDEIPY